MTTPTPTTVESDTDYLKKLINRSNVKKLTLDHAATREDIKFERVSGEFYDELNAKVLEIVKTHVDNHSAVGKTIYGFSRIKAPTAVEAAPEVAPVATPAV